MTSIDKKRDDQFRIIKAAEAEIIKWSQNEGIELFRVEFVVPFVDTDFSIVIWFFYKTDVLVSIYERDGTSDQLKSQFLNILRDLKYPDGYIKQVTFEIDSDENVQKNYSGSYFYRLR
jgi:hypothetical protein